MHALGRFPTTPIASFSDPTTATLQAVLDKAVNEGLAGVTASILAGGRGTWTGAAGTSDGVQPMEVASQFGIASITKTVIAAEIMWLAEEGLLKLDDPVAAHLPAMLEFDPNGATIRQLLSMTSGLQDSALTDAALSADPLREWKPEEILASVPNYPIPPGTSFRYSNTNYILLGLVIEQVTGTTVAKALRAHLLADPELASLVYQTEERPQGPLALPFIGPGVRPNILELGGGYLATRADASAGGAAGGMASDAAALARFAYLLWGGQLLTEASLRAMTDFGSGAGYRDYGLGTIDMTNMVLGKPFPVQAIGHGGQDSAGYASIMITFPSEATVVTVLINQDVDPRLLALPLAQELYEASVSTAPSNAAAIDGWPLTATFVSPTNGFSFGYVDRGGLAPARSLWDPVVQPRRDGTGRNLNVVGLDTVETGLNAFFAAASAVVPDGVSIDEWVAEYITPGGCSVLRSQQAQITIDGQTGMVSECENQIEATVVAGGRLYLFTLLHDRSDARAVFDAWIATIDLTPETAAVP